MKNESAGDGSPYWYEWTAGLVKVVGMLYPDSGIASVTFQKDGVKGWDDVVVRHHDGKTDYIQVKHTREGANLTFGSFLAPDDRGGTLLANLFAAWREMALDSSTATCTVFTNREAGMNTYKGRPPLLDFTEWLENEARERASIDEFVVPDEWNVAWNEWLNALKPASDVERLDFLRGFRIETNRPDLDALQSEVLDELAKAFGTSDAKAVPLLQALNDALKRWTTQREAVTPEIVFSALALPSDPDVVKPAPPPPVPFFPTREQEAGELEQMLVAQEGPSVVFLCAEPGAGKTSLLSRMEIRRNNTPLSGIVGLRYFAFLPITPASRGTPVETDYYVDPKVLWFSLLSQLRRELNGALWKYAVPVRNEILTWSQARDHVLRLADRIGRELGRRFVIVIDGIDHAARAGRLRYDKTFAEEFFRSLPGPEELAGCFIRLLVAGQPAADYDEYPAWLKAHVEGVETVYLKPLGRGDVASLFEERRPGIPHAEWDKALDVILAMSGGNTLSIVFAIEEAARSSSFEELRERLENRRIGQGLRFYYESIWRYAFSNLRNHPGIETAIAGSLCMARERLSGDYLASVFHGLGHSGHFWQLILIRLGPLVVSDGNGFRVLHNDVRVFLANLLGERPAAERVLVASCLADHYLAPGANREMAHASVLPLLRLAGRESEWARAFTVQWVFEAAALGRAFHEVSEQCKSALAAAVELRDWDTLHELACAVETVGRWENNQHNVQNHRDVSDDGSEPFFPPSELVVQPFESWTANSLQQVTGDVARIARSGSTQRAIAILERWFSGLSLNELAERIYPAAGGDPTRHEIGCTSADRWFEGFGKVCRSLSWIPSCELSTAESHRRAEYFFEKGWVEVSGDLGLFRSLASYFQGCLPRFYQNMELAISDLARCEQWRLAGRMLRLCHDDRSKLSRSFRMSATWWCVRCGLETRCPGWLEPLGEPLKNASDGIKGDTYNLLSVAKASGWLNPAGESSEIAGDIRDRVTSDRSRRGGGSLAVLLNAAVMLGQVTSLLARNKAESARILLPPATVGRIAEALWSREWNARIESTEYASVAGRLATEWVRVFAPLSKEHQHALVEVALPIAATGPGDFRRDGVWLLMKLAGKTDVLVNWLEKVIGEDGWLWTEGVDSREETAREFYLAAARDIGETELACAVENKLKWQRIGYVGHKDYSFHWPCTWFEELAAMDPACVRDAGFRLIAISVACSQQSGDNRLGPELRAAIGAAAIASGPDDVWRIAFSERGTQEANGWLGETKGIFLDGFLDRMASPMPLEEKVVCWCISLALARWHDADDVGLVCRIRDTMLSSCESAAERESLKKLIQRISPGEYRRSSSREKDDDDNITESSADTDWRADLEAGRRLAPGKALDAIRAHQHLGADERETENRRVLEQFGTNNSMSGGWGGYSGELKSVLMEMTGLIPDAQLWTLVRSALIRCDEGGYWYSAVSGNLQALLLARASRAGRVRLESGLRRILDMHHRWACGGNLALPLPAVHPAEGSAVTSWEELAVRIFTTLLSSRYGNVVESAMIGLNAFVSWRPNCLPSVYAAIGTDAWRVRWLLTLSEVWAVTHPDAMETAADRLAELSVGAPLDIRLQVWIVTTIMNRGKGVPAPSFVFVDPNAPNNRVAVNQIPGILHTTPQMRGSFRLVDRHLSAATVLRKVETTTGIDCDDLEPRIGARLLALGGTDDKQRPWPELIHNANDWLCPNERGHQVINEELDRVLGERIGSSARLQRFAQGFLGSEDGWILRQSPMPHPVLGNWPSSDRLGGDYHHSPASSEVRDWLRQTTVIDGIGANEKVIAACMKAYSWREDFVYECWFQERPQGLHPSNGMPTTLNGRSFAWMLATNWWERRMPAGSRSIAFRTGGCQQLLHCFPEVIPSRIWLSEFGWCPSESNPYLWYKAGVPVARFESLHGPLDSHTTYAGRTPVLHRWVVNANALNDLMTSAPTMTWSEEFSRTPFKDD